MLSINLYCCNYSYEKAVTLLHTFLIGLIFFVALLEQNNCNVSYETFLVVSYKLIIKKSCLGEINETNDALKGPIHIGICFL